MSQLTLLDEEMIPARSTDGPDHDADVDPAAPVPEEFGRGPDADWDGEPWPEQTYDDLRA